MNARDAIAANIRAERARRGIGQLEVAEAMQALGYNWIRQTVGTCERGKRQVTAEEVLGLARVLGTTVQSLMNV